MIRLGAPISAAFLAQMAIGVTDVVLMGWLGPESLAAGTLASNFTNLMFYFGMGVGTAVAPMVAQALGARRIAEVRPTVQAGVAVALALSLPFGMVAWWGEHVLLLLGQEPETAARAVAFLRTAVWSLPANLVFVVAEKRRRRPQPAPKPSRHCRRRLRGQRRGGLRPDVRRLGLPGWNWRSGDGHERVDLDHGALHGT